MRLLSFSFLFFILFLNNSCSDETNNNHAKIIFDHYKNGNYKTVYQFFKDTASLDDDYYFIEYYENGNIKICGLENKQIRRGKWIFNRENGNLLAELFFHNDSLYGPIRLYDQNGKLIASDSFENRGLVKNEIKIINFIHENNDFFGERIDWIDSIQNATDSLYSLCKKLKPEFK